MVEQGTNTILCGDALEELAKLPAASIDLVACDPPYGYSFMGKNWDRAVPTAWLWAECLRVLKPGAFCFVMSAPRSDVQMHMVQNLTEAGFRLDFTPIYWTYASGFPKAGNIGKLVDKRLGVEREILGKYKSPENTSGGKNRKFIHTNTKHPVEGLPDITAPATDQAKALDGSYAGFQPKPAVEVIIVAMKPLSEKTYVDQALKNGKGITWLDDCRIPTSETLSTGYYPGEDAMGNAKGSSTTGERQKVENTQGRFPANLLVSDDVLNDGVERKARNGNRKATSDSGHSLTFNHTDDEIRSDFQDSGSYSRYFDLDKWASTLPFLIVPKASKSEKNKGLEHLPEKYSPTMGGGIGVKDARDVRKVNVHPTVKPLRLMSYLITLGSREGDVVLDPFVGSGTTCVAAKKLKRNYIGIEREAEYVEIAKARLDADKQETLL